MASVRQHGVTTASDPTPQRLTRACRASRLPGPCVSFSSAAMLALRVARGE
jgi:hypothetical protein